MAALAAKCSKVLLEEIAVLEASVQVRVEDAGSTTVGGLTDIGDRYPFLVLRMAESLIMSVVQPFFNIWRLRALYRALFVVGIAQSSLWYENLCLP